MKRVLAIAIGMFLSSGLAQAGTVLYWTDADVGTNRMTEALAASSQSVTTASDGSNFVTLLGGGGWDLVVLMVQGNFQTAAQTAVQSWANGGGKAIYADWSENNFGSISTSNAFDAGFTGNTNDTTLSITDGALLSGLSSPLTLFNPGWGIFSTGLTPLAGGVVGATFGGGDAAIIFGNGRSTIINGFLADTFANGADGVQLYTNEINTLLNQPVPEPMTIGMLGAGIAALAARRRRG